MEILIVIPPVVVDFLFPDDEKGKKRGNIMRVMAEFDRTRWIIQDRTIIYNGNRTHWSTIQGFNWRVISNHSIRRSMVTINQPCRKQLHHQVWKHATAGNQKTAPWSGIALNHKWFTRQQLQWKTTCQLKLMLDALRPLLNQDLPITNLLLTTPTRDSVKTRRSVSLLGVWSKQV